MPAKVFFDIRETRNFQLMRPKPKATNEQLEAIFDVISDEYFVKLDNHDATEYLRLRNEFAFKSYLQATIKSILALIWQTPLTLWDHHEVKAGRMATLTAINKHLDTPIDLDADFTDELTRVLNVEMGIITDELHIIKEAMKTMEGNEKAVIFDFYDELVGLQSIHGYTLSEKMLLPMYVAEVKSALKKAAKQKTK